MGHTQYRCCMCDKFICDNTGGDYPAKHGAYQHHCRHSKFHIWHAHRDSGEELVTLDYKYMCGCSVTSKDVVAKDDSAKVTRTTRHYRCTRCGASLGSRIVEDWNWG